MKTKILCTLFAILLLCWFLPSLSQAQSDINLSGYTQTFDDEFNSLSVTSNSPKGASTWYYWPPYGAAGAYSASTWDVASFSVSNGIISDKAWLDASNNWHSGNLSSMDNTGIGFAQQYGYFEIRCQMPNSGSGAWPAFWLMTSNSIPSNAGVREEIDIFEWYGATQANNPGQVQQASHNWNADASQNQSAPYVYSPYTNLPAGSAQAWAGFHIYGCQVDPVHVTWYIDGVQTNQMATPSAYLTSPFYMMIDYALGGGWPLSGMVNNSSLNVDWVRVYSLPTSGGPMAPTGVTATAGNSQIALSWAASSGATSYNVYRGTSAGGESGTPIVTGITGTTYTDTSLTNGSTYYYVVKAVNSSGTSGSSSEVSATPSGGGGSGTFVYNDGFTRTSALSGSRPDVTDTNGNTWTETLWGSVGGSVLVPNGTLLPSASGNIDGGILPVNGTSGVALDGTKNFTLSANFVQQSSSLSVNLFLGTTSSGLADLKMQGNGAVYAMNNNSLIGYGATSYPTPQNHTLTLSYVATTGLITYAIDGAPCTSNLAVTPAQLQALTNIGFEFDYSGANGASVDNFTLVVGTATSGGPMAPTGVTATAGNSQIALSWAASSGATSYNVYRGMSAGGESGTPIVTGITGTTYTDTSLTNGFTYYYVVKAVNSSGTSGSSSEVSATPSGGGGSGTFVYNDGFTRTSALSGSRPDVTDTNGNTWTETLWGSVGGSVLVPNGTLLPSASGNIDGGILPVNGTSGVALDGTKNFTLSANFVQQSSSLSVNLFLGTTSSGLADLKMQGNGAVYAMNNNSLIGYGATSYPTPQNHTLTLSYVATTGLITYAIDGAPCTSTLAVTPAQLQALTNIGFEFDYSGANGASVDNFTLVVGP